MSYASNKGSDPKCHSSQNLKAHPNSAYSQSLPSGRSLGMGEGAPLFIIMAKDPAVLFYTSDFLAGTMTMQNEHVGMYIRLLCLQHQKGVLTENDMTYICKTYVEDVYTKFKKDKDGNYYNERLKYEALKRKNYSESRRKNVQKRYSTYVVHMENENENINKKDLNKKKVSEKQKKEDDFDQLTAFQKIWELYPAKGRLKRSASLRFWCETVVSRDIASRIQKALQNYGEHLRANSEWKHPKEFPNWLSEWPDWEFHEEPPTAEQEKMLSEHERLTR